MASTDVKKVDRALTGMSLNILEAIWNDVTADEKEVGRKQNAMAGLGLIAVMEEKSYYSITKLKSAVLPQQTTLLGDGTYSLLPDLSVAQHPKQISCFAADAEWRDLYNSWNCYFVSNTLDNVFLPIKLLIPSIPCLF